MNRHISVHCLDDHASNDGLADQTPAELIAMGLKLRGRSRRPGKTSQTKSHMLNKDYKGILSVFESAEVEYWGVCTGFG